MLDMVSQLIDRRQHPFLIVGVQPVFPPAEFPGSRPRRVPIEKAHLRRREGSPRTQRQSLAAFSSLRPFYVASFGIAESAPTSTHEPALLSQRLIVVFETQQSQVVDVIVRRILVEVVNMVVAFLADAARKVGLKHYFVGYGTRYRLSLLSHSGPSVQPRSLLVACFS